MCTVILHANGGFLTFLCSAGLDVQLKVLQILPSLFQRYEISLSGQTLASTLEICATLQNAKTTAVANTAAATLQQLVVFAFEKVAKQDGLSKVTLGPVVLHTLISRRPGN